MNDCDSNESCVPKLLGTTQKHAYFPAITPMQLFVRTSWQPVCILFQKQFTQKEILMWNHDADGAATVIVCGAAAAH